eukprot:scaffold39679_cov153-Skeletonema_marinoi.AAC.3
MQSGLPPSANRMDIYVAASLQSCARRWHNHTFVVDHFNCSMPLIRIHPSEVAAVTCRWAVFEE